MHHQQKGNTPILLWLLQWAGGRAHWPSPSPSQASRWPGGWPAPAGKLRVAQGLDTPTPWPALPTLQPSLSLSLSRPQTSTSAPSALNPDFLLPSPSSLAPLLPSSHLPDARCSLLHPSPPSLKAILHGRGPLGSLHCLSSQVTPKLRPASSLKGGGTPRARIWPLWAWDPPGAVAQAPLAQPPVPAPPVPESSWRPQHKQLNMTLVKVSEGTDRPHEDTLSSSPSPQHPTKYNKIQ